MSIQHRSLPVASALFLLPFAPGGGLFGEHATAFAQVVTRTASAQDTPLEERLDRLTNKLEASRVTEHVPGMAISIVRAGEVIYAQGFGLADVAAERAASPETIFAIGSSTKAFTAAAIGMLVDEEAMAWDDPVTRHLPEYVLPVDFEEEKAEVTLRDMLSHRTGFTRMGVLWASGAVDRRGILATATKAEPWAPFRKEFHYNNVMYLAAGEALGVASKSSWDAFVAERILEPIGMRATSLTVAAAKQSENLALGYRWDADDGVFERDPMRTLDSIAPAGSINSNVLDMARWVRLLLARGEVDGKRLIEADRLEEMWAPTIKVGGGKQYGLGWFIEEWKGRRVVQHGGNIDGFSAMVALLPDDDVGFVLLMNVGGTGLQETSRGIVFSALLDDVTARSPVADASSDDLLGTYVANYAHFDGEEFTVLRRDGVLAIDVPSQRVFELEPADESGMYAFRIAPEAIQASFVRGEDGSVKALVMHQNGLAFEVPREGVPQDVDGTEEDFARYLGTYEHPQMPEPVTVRFLGGRLVCDIPGQMAFDLRLPAEDRVWRFRATDDLGVEFIDGADGAVTALTFHERGTRTECPRLSAGKAELPSAKDLRALRRAEAVSARLDEWGTLRLSGTLRLVHAGVEGSVVVTTSGRDSVRSDLSFGPFGRQTVAVSSASGWTDSSFDPFESLDGVLLDQARLSHPAVFFGDWDDHFDQIQVVRSGEVGERKCFVVRLVKGELPAWNAFVDAETGDTLRLDASTVIPGIGTIPQTVFLEDHRDVEGVRLPFRVITETPANGRLIVQYETFEHGIELPGDHFDAPE